MKKHQLPLILAIAAGLASVLTPNSHADTIYVTNNFASNIMQFTAGGAGSVFANTAISPWGLAFDSTGNLYVAMPNDNTIAKFSPTGAPLGDFANGSSGISHPSALAFDTAGNLYAANINDNTIRKFTSGGVASLFASTGLVAPTGLVFDSTGNLYAANGNGNSIQKYSSTGTDLGFFASSGGASPYGLAFDTSGNLYVANNGGGGIVKITPGGVGSLFADIGATPVALAFDSAGDLYATYNSPYNFIRKFSSTGTDLGVFASTGLNNPMYIAIQVPEPSSAVLLLSGVALCFRRRTLCPHDEALHPSMR